MIFLIQHTIKLLNVLLVINIDNVPVRALVLITTLVLLRRVLRVHGVSVTEFEMGASSQPGVILKLAVGWVQGLAHASIRCQLKIDCALRYLVLNINHILQLLLLILIQTPGLLF